MHDMEFFQPVLIITCFSQLIRITDITSHFCILLQVILPCSLPVVYAPLRVLFIALMTFIVLNS